MLSCRSSLLMLSAALAACAPPAPAASAPAPAPVVVPAIVVNAPFAKTWDAFVSLMVEQQVTPKTLLRESGLIETGFSEQYYRIAEADGLAACPAGHRSLPEYSKLGIDVIAHVHPVAGDSTKTNIDLKPRFVEWRTTGYVECQTRGSYERSLGAMIKARAEQ
ncbi:MAG TPA: hypothetical protein VH439_17255 [Gemmatimonadales bacterium]